MRGFSTPKNLGASGVWGKCLTQSLKEREEASIPLPKNRPQVKAWKAITSVFLRVLRGFA
jgi:hypothetical protein